MKKRISFTAYMDIDSEDYDEGCELPNSFNEAEDCDYDNIGRPLGHLEDVGWVIKNKKIKTIEE